GAAIHIARVRAGSRQVGLDVRGFPGAAGDIVVDEGTVLTTDQATTGIIPGNGGVKLAATGRVRLDAVTLDAARDVQVKTRTHGDDLCLANGTHLEAVNADGVPRSISLTGVRGTVFDDGSTTFTGLLRSGPIVAGTCP